MIAQNYQRVISGRIKKINFKKNGFCVDALCSSGHYEGYNLSFVVPQRYVKQRGIYSQHTTGF